MPNYQQGLNANNFKFSINIFRSKCIKMEYNLLFTQRALAKNKINLINLLIFT